MRSFAMIAGFAAAANAAAYGYPAQNATSLAPLSYPASTPAGYTAVSSYAAPAYSTTIKTGISTVCSTPATLTYGTKTYIVTKPTTIIDTTCVYTTSVPVKPTPVAGQSSPIAPVPVYSSAPVVPYPSQNGTAPTGPAPTGTKPTSTKPAPSQFTGAAAQTGAAMLAIVGAVAAFL